MNQWFPYAVGAAIFYGLHQVFTKLASGRVGDGIGGFIVEATAAVAIAFYLVFLKFSGHWDQPADAVGIFYSILTGLCVGIGTILFFLLFQKGGSLSTVPMILAGGAALMAIVGLVFFHESTHWIRLTGIVLSITGLLLVRYAP